MKFKPRVMVVEMAGVSNLGIDNDVYFKNLARGYTRMTRLDLPGLCKYRTKFAGKVHDADLKVMKRRLTPLLDSRPFDYQKHKETFYSLYCLHNIIKKSKQLPSKTGLIVGTGCGNLNSLEMTYRDLFIKDKAHPLAIVEGMSNFVSSYMTILFGIKGPSFVISTACSSGTNAIGLGFKMIQSGMIDACICGGVDCGLTETAFRTWDKMRVMSKKNEDPNKAMKPFSAERDGFVLSEGAAYFLLVREDKLSQYNYPSYCEISGYASNSAAEHLTRPNVESQANCIEDALADASVSSNDVDYINAHGTSTVLNDLTETNSIKEVFGNRAYDIPISSTKSMIGHSLGASGPLELLATILCMNKKIIHPTINYNNQDSLCDLNYVPNNAVQADVNIFLKNSFAFGGNNVCIVGKKT